MAWIFLLLSGLAEVSGVTFLKLSKGFTRLKPTIGAIISGMFSFYFLSRALQQIPISTAYGIWTGIGSAGGVLLGMYLFRESRDVRKLIFIGMIITSVIGLRVVGGGH
ncbi:QacE family quaternary ammonium compound efflux SMR transporter [Paenibacillus sp. 598K]|uniref:DMT family transporter n=1 Tax=Paenibacillus sp. 598K TaxID=1117987 RepID=UPI000FFA2018|nr:multidrug efflux SMR transporter [Paenibacillus sp. 598K]GBF74566.1 QacE family quaternary ammonium compound efflux SMR transporter [Paenibacillus sp. 598K]